MKLTYLNDKISTDLNSATDCINTIYSWNKCMLKVLEKSGDLIQKIINTGTKTKYKYKVYIQTERGLRRVFTL